MTGGRESGAGARVLVIGLVLAGCSALGLEVPERLSGGDIYVGDDAATITITTKVGGGGSVYIEGALQFAKLEGPSSFDWLVNDGSGTDRGPHGGYIAGVQSSSVKPGEYRLTSWEQVCDGNCGNLDGPQGHCSLEFTAMPGETVEILVTYVIPEPCTAERLE
jgi:hypothetical protein